MNELVPVKTRRPWGAGPKYRPGPCIENLHELLRAIEQGRWIYYAGSVKHPSVISNMSLATLRGAVKYGRLRWAMENTRP